MGLLGSGELSYEMARDLLRDKRPCLPPGVTLAAQGITSGPLFDKMANSLLGLDVHHMSGCASWYPRRPLLVRPRVFKIRSATWSTG